MQKKTGVDEKEPNEALQDSNSPYLPERKKFVKYIMCRKKNGIEKTFRKYIKKGVNWNWNTIASFVSQNLIVSRRLTKSHASVAQHFTGTKEVRKNKLNQKTY